MSLRSLFIVRYKFPDLNLNEPVGPYIYSLKVLPRNSRKTIRYSTPSSHAQGITRSHKTVAATTVQSAIGLLTLQSEKNRFARKRKAKSVSSLFAQRIRHSQSTWEKASLFPSVRTPVKESCTHISAVRGRFTFAGRFCHSV